MTTRRFEHAADKKFWSITVEGPLYKYAFGKIGSNGQTKIKRFADEASARQDAEAAIGDKVKHGYAEVGPAPAPPARPAVRGWQFIHPNGDVALPGPYEEAHGFRGGVANVRVNGKWGMIDTQGRFVAPPQYEVVYPAHQGRSGFKEGGKVGYLDASGAVVIPPQFDEATNFDIPSVPLALFRVGRAWGVIRLDGSVFVPAEWDGVSVGRDGWVRVVRKGLSGFVDASGKQVIDVKFRCDNFREERALVNVDGTFGFLDRRGELAIEPVYENGVGFADGLAWVRKAGKYGAIDKDGKVVIDFAFDGVVSFGDGRAFVWDPKGRVSLIDRSGKPITDTTWGDAESFQHGTAVVGKTASGPYGLVDTNGRVLLPLDYQAIDGVEGSHRRIKRDERYGYANLEGAVVCEPRFFDARPLPEDLAAVETMIASAPITVPVAEPAPAPAARKHIDLPGGYKLFTRPPLVESALPVSDDAAAVRKLVRATEGTLDIAHAGWWWLEARGDKAIVALEVAAEELLARLDRARDWNDRRTAAEAVQELLGAMDRVVTFEGLRARTRLFGSVREGADVMLSLRALALAARDGKRPEDAARSFARIAAAHPDVMASARVPDAELEGFRAVATQRGLGIPQAAGDEIPVQLRSAAGKPKSLPDFWEPAELARPLLAGRKKALPIDAVEQIGQHLEKGDLDVEGLRRVCDAASLRDFAWSVFLAWLQKGAPSKQKWALTMLGDFGDDTLVPALARDIGEWPGQSAHARAVLGLSVLASIGTDRALAAIHRLSQRAKFGGLKGEAQSAIRRIAKQRGLTEEELADRLVPTLGLGDDGTLTLDFGARTYRVAFDETLKPYVIDDGGKRHDDLPKPKQTDDAAQAAEAQATWKELKKEARSVASLQIERLERAMCTRRRWHLDAFRQYFVEHPLLRHLAHRLVWGVFRGGVLGGTFRVAEDGSFADAADAAVTVADGEEVGIVHAIDLDAPALTRWSQVLADYEVVQPFEQLARRVHQPTSDEETSRELRRFAGRSVKAGAVMGLLSRGWSRGPAGDNGVVDELHHALGTMPIQPGIYFGVAAEQDDQTLGPIKLARLDPLAFSELVRSLEHVAS